VSYVVALPEVMSAAATDVASIGSTVTAANRGVAGATTGVLAAAEDEVSAAIAALFSAHGRGYQALSAQATAFHAEFVQALTGAAGAYTAAEAANASPLGSIEKAFLGAEHEIQQIPTTLATGFGNELNFLLTAPSSPLLAQFTGNNPLFGLFLSNTPPRLLPLLLGETVQHTTYDGMSVVQIAPAHPDGNYVVAIHGGAFILPPTIFHWIDYSMMAYQTGATIEVPIYPLMQQGGTAGVVVPKMAGLISTEITAHGASHVSVLGDSAGGTLALASVEYLVANNQAVPASMVLLSPWLDVSDTNPNIAYVHDPDLPPLGSGAQNIGKVWAGNLPENNYEVSPLYGSLKGLPTTYVYSGSLDSVSPDALVLQQEAVAQGAPISFALVNGEIHDWIFLSPDGIHYWPQIDQELGI
jgi:triacylglycerol lipase